MITGIILAIVFGVLVYVGVTIGKKWIFKATPDAVGIPSVPTVTSQQDLEHPVVEPETTSNDGPRRRRPRAIERMIAARTAQPLDDDAGSVTEDHTVSVQEPVVVEENSDSSDGEEEVGGVKVKGKKRLLKEQRKREAREMREALEEEKRQKALKKEEEEALRLEEKAKQDELERQALEVIENARKEREKKEEEEYQQKWKGLFTVEETGEAADQLTDEHFIEFIEKRKVVPLSDMAVEFSLSQQDVIARIKQLETSGKLSGVFDDRGKFVSISQQELKGIAKFIRQRGRVAMSELVGATGRLIALDS